VCSGLLLKASSSRITALPSPPVVVSSGVSSPLRSSSLIYHLRSSDKRRSRRVFGRLTLIELARIDEGLELLLGVADEA
jgi:hypothetical protein